MTRRAVLNRTAAEKFSHPSRDPNRGAYRLLPMSSTTDNHLHDDARSAMLKHDVEEADDNVDEYDDDDINRTRGLQANYGVQIRSKRTKTQQRIKKQHATKRSGHVPLREEDSLEEVDLV